MTGAITLSAGALAAFSVALFPEHPQVPVLAVGAVLLLGVGIFRPMAVVALGVLAIPLEGFAGGAVVGPSQAIFGVAALAWLVGWLARRPLTLPRHPALPAFAVLVVANAAGLFFAPEPTIVVRQVVTWGTLLVIFACLAETRDERAIRSVLLAFAAAGGIAGLIAVVDPQPASSIVFAGADVERATAGLGSPNALGMLLGLALPIQLMFALSGAPAYRACGTGFAALSLLGMALAVSRGSFIGLAVALCVMALWPPFLRAVAVVLPTLILVGLLFTNPVSAVPNERQITERLTEVRSTTGTDLRVPLWRATPRMIRDHPVFGLGALEYPHYAAEYGLPDTQGRPTHAHNVVLTIAAELGLLGLTAFVALALAVGSALRGATRAPNAETRAMGYALVAAFTGFLVSGVVDYGLDSAPLAGAVFVLAGCAVSLGISARDKTTGSRPAETAGFLRSRR